MLAAQGIALGDIDIAVAGGMESMSNCPYLLPRAREDLQAHSHEQRGRTACRESDMEPPNALIDQRCQAEQPDAHLTVRVELHRVAAPRRNPSAQPGANCKAA